MAYLETVDGVQTADFEFGFTLNGKAVLVEEDDSGDLYIEGLAADFGMDRQEEAFEPGAFEAGLKAYMSSNPILLYHHKSDISLGQVISASLSPEGLHVKARVDAPEPNTMIADYYRKIKKGTLRAFSVGGQFHRHMTPNGPRIFKCDMGELSITPYPVNPRTIFAIAGKAFESAPAAEVEVDMTDFEDRLAQIDADLKAIAEGKSYQGDNPPSNSGKNIKKGVGHPDAAPVAGLLQHMVKIHTLAENTAQNAADPEVAKVAAAAQKSVAKHSSDLHHIAARIGPLPDYYGPLA